MSEREAHWQNIYSTRSDQKVSWFQPVPQASLTRIEAARGALKTEKLKVIDVGGGASRLVDHLIALGDDVTVLDLSSAALEISKTRLGEGASAAKWVAGDITGTLDGLGGGFDLWHDRAVFHFMRSEEHRSAYLQNMRRFLRPGAQVILATFAEDGPERCSGLPVQRYSPTELAETLGPDFKLLDSERVLHGTPAGGAQRFIFTRFQAP